MHNVDKIKKKIKYLYTYITKVNSSEINILKNR